MNSNSLMCKYLFLRLIRVIINAINLLFCYFMSIIYFSFIKLFNMLFVCVTAGLLFLASKYHNDVLRSVKNLCHSITTKNNEDDNKGKKCSIPLNNIILADSPAKCDYAVQRIRRNLCNGVLGFDCEWVNEGRISLLQLATYNGVCALFRLGKIGYVPPKLKELLANECILKVGVAPFEDGRKLTNDYGCRVFGTVDLRMFAEGVGLQSRKSLAALCMQYLGIELEKLFEVRCGNWDADTLSDEQIAYAAYDAIVSALIYQEMQRLANRKRSFLRNILLFVKSIYKGKSAEDASFIHDLPPGIKDVKFREISESPTINNNNVNVKNKNANLSSKPLKVANIPTRKEPLYHNCYLQAPDGETLCTCDRKKAEWYVNKGLGVLVNEDPLTVKLNFEPSGRALGQVGEYYTQVKVNQCVVCGSQDKFIKKNVVPREYRRYFPLVMKAHQSHDVLLLCPVCHELSNRYDLELRRELAILCDAPMSRQPPTLKNNHHHQKRQVLRAAKALRDSPSLPPHRRKELEARVLEFTENHDFNNSEYHETSSLSSAPTKPTPHGLKVVTYFTNSENGLIALERMWRENFLKTMKPKFLPKLWSVRHNQERLEIRKIQNRIEPEDAKVAGLMR